MIHVYLNPSFSIKTEIRKVGKKCISASKMPLRTCTALIWPLALSITQSTIIRPAVKVPHKRKAQHTHLLIWGNMSGIGAPAHWKYRKMPM